MEESGWVVYSDERWTGGLRSRWEGRARDMEGFWLWPVDCGAEGSCVPRVKWDCGIQDRAESWDDRQAPFYRACAHMTD